MTDKEFFEREILPLVKTIKQKCRVRGNAALLCCIAFPAEDDPINYVARVTTMLTDDYAQLIIAAELCAGVRSIVRERSNPEGEVVLTPPNDIGPGAGEPRPFSSN